MFCVSHLQRFFLSPLVVRDLLHATLRRFVVLFQQLYVNKDVENLVDFRFRFRFRFTLLFLLLLQIFFILQGLIRKKVIITINVLFRNIRLGIGFISKQSLLTRAGRGRWMVGVTLSPLCPQCLVFRTPTEGKVSKNKIN